MHIDAHQHFWRYSPEEYPWMTAEMAVLQRDFLPSDLEPELRVRDLHGCVAVQARHGLEETRFLLELADSHEFVRAVVGWVDLRAADVEEQLAEFAGHPKLTGIRHIVQDEPDDRFLLDEAFGRGIAALARHDLVYDVLIYPRHLPVATEFVARHPDQPFVLDHLAKPFIKDGEVEPWRTHLRELAAHRNVTCKLSGLVTEAAWNAWTLADVHPYLDAAFDAFGEDRLMYGSDWPVCLLAAPDYGAVYRLVHEWSGDLDEEARDKIFGRNAARTYRLRK